MRSFSTAGENTQVTPKAFNSPYSDSAYGGSIELGVDLSAADRFTFGAQYRRDEHNEAQQSFSATTLPSGTTEPNQRDLEETYSLAAENPLTLAPGLILTAGAGYDWRNLLEAQDYGAPLGTNPNTTPNQLYSYPLRNSSAWSAQGQLAWQVDPATNVHASVSSRARFPTIFERFSQKFGTSIPNPDLRPERATNYEIGGSHAFGAVHAEGAVFYSRIDDAIVSFPTLAYSCTGSVVAPTTGACPQVSLVESRNLGTGKYYGAELSVSAQIGSRLTIGGNYTHTHRDLNDPSNTAFRPTDVPEHKAFLYADFAPIARLHLFPSLEIASDRWTVTDIAPIVYYRTGSYVNAAMRADVTVREQCDGRCRREEPAGRQLRAGRRLSRAGPQLLCEPPRKILSPRLCGQSSGRNDAIIQWSASLSAAASVAASTSRYASSSLRPNVVRRVPPWSPRPARVAMTGSAQLRLRLSASTQTRR